LLSFTNSRVDLPRFRCLGWRPEQGKTDKEGNSIEDRIYNRKDFDRNLVIEERTDIDAKKLTEFLKGFDSFAKTIVFCVDIDHAERMRSALQRHNSDLAAANHKYIMQITGDNDEGKRELENFTNPEEKYPVVATTSELMTTGIDAQTRVKTKSVCKRCGCFQLYKRA